MLSENEIQKNLMAFENAVAQQRLEILEPSKKAISELERAVRGEISISKVLQGIKKRPDDGQILKSRRLS
jgi:hypothetical protein